EEVDEKPQVVPREVLQAREEVGHEPSEIAREALLRDRLEVRLRRREQRRPDQEGHQQARVALASYLRLGANAQRALERPSREREEERHVELMDEPHEEGEGRRGVGSLQGPRRGVPPPAPLHTAT